MNRPTVLLCMGTRPEIIKMAPVYHALRQTPLRPVVVHTGQHDSIAWPLYRFFGMEPDHVLDLPRDRPTLGHLNARLLDAIDGLLGEAEANAVLVHGDTSSALSAATAAFYARVPVGHVEAGLRSGDPTNPFPEEMNRTVIARLARWHFAPTRGAVRNLLRESVLPDAVTFVGNTIVDAVHQATRRLDENGGRPTDLPDEMSGWAAGGRLLLVTMHRRENWGHPIENAAAVVAEMVRDHPDLRVLWPVHPNPSVRRAVDAGFERTGLTAEESMRVRLTAPLDYPSLIWALRESWMILTDSGGIQEEAAALGRPILVLRRTTERPEVADVGGALVGVNAVAIRNWLHEVMTRPASHEALQDAENPYGDGRAGERIARVLAHELLDDASLRPVAGSTESSSSPVNEAAPLPPSQKAWPGSSALA